MLCSANRSSEIRLLLLISCWWYCHSAFERVSLSAEAVNGCRVSILDGAALVFTYGHPHAGFCPEGCGYDLPCLDGVIQQEGFICRLLHSIRMLFTLVDTNNRRSNACPDDRCLKCRISCLPSCCYLFISSLTEPSNASPDIRCPMCRIRHLSPRHCLFISPLVNTDNGTEQYKSRCQVPEAHHRASIIPPLLVHFHSYQCWWRNRGMWLPTTGAQRATSGLSYRLFTTIHHTWHLCSIKAAFATVTQSLWDTLPFCAF